ncbi:MAG: AAA family ATPase [Porphyromonas sp.]|nr:AAA family ATPase [Porphyromonas sp.]
METKETVRIAVSGIKGGTGKSTIAMLLGTVAREYFDKKVCLVDCDIPQAALSNQKKSEELFFLNHPEIRDGIIERRFPKPKFIEPLPLLVLKDLSQESIIKIEEEHDEYDLFIYDTKGSEGEPSFFLTLTSMDYIILPLILDNINTRSSYMWIKGMKYALSLSGCGERNKGILALFNKYISGDTDQIILREWWEKTAEEESVQILKSELHNSAFIEKNISTIKSGNDVFFQSVSIAPDEGVLSLTNAIAVVKDVMEFVDGGRVNVSDALTESPKNLVQPTPTTEASVLNLIDAQVQILNNISEKIRTGNILVSQLKIAEQIVKDIDFGPLETLLSDLPSRD